VLGAYGELVIPTETVDDYVCIYDGGCNTKLEGIKSTSNYISNSFLPRKYHV
jgi:hypothetical protein